MTLQELLTKRKKAILDRCLDLFFDTYPQESVALLKSRQDPFANPVGSTFRKELEIIFDRLAARADTETMIPSLDAIVRIRAVQEFRPSDAIAFTTHLKKAIREELKNAHEGQELTSDLSGLDSRIDELTFVAFDLYMACREKIADIRVSEARSERDRLARVVQAMERGETGSGGLGPGS
jgi:RsbT co-antagonist protein rsbRD N-terminal domain